MVKSELIGEYVMTNPAIEDAKDNIAIALAGSAGGGFQRCLPPRPSATTYTTRTGIHASRSYLSHWMMLLEQEHNQCQRTKARP